jgi:Mg-chelatase subunit ChlD
MYIEVTTAAAETVAKILARRRDRFGIKYEVKIGTRGGLSASVRRTGPGAAVIELPSLPSSAWLTRAEADRIVGYVAHECGHLIHTDMNAWVNVVKTGSERLARWVNCLEDVRMEQAEIKAGVFPAVRGLFERVTDYMHHRDMRTAPREIGSTVADLPYVTVVLGRIANGYVIPSAHGLRAAVPAVALPILERALSGVRACDHTQACVVLAHELMAMEAALPQASQAPAAPPKQPQDDQDDQDGDDQDAPGGGDGDQDGDDQDGDDQGGDQGAPGGGDATDGDTDGSSAGGGDGDATDGDGSSGDGDGDQGAPGGEGGGDDKGAGGTGHGDGSGGTVDDPGHQSGALDDIGERAREEVDRMVRDNDTLRGLAGYKNEVIRRGPSNGAAYGSDQTARSLDARLPKRAVLSGQISRLLVAPERSWTTHRETSGRLDRRALARVGTGALDVFSRREEQAGVDTALMVLVDGSGSMKVSGRMETAMVTAWHIASAADTAGARVAVYVFYTGEVSAKLWPVVEFGESVRARAGAFPHVTPQAFTPLSPAILGAAELLMGEALATRRILMVLTDGDCDLGNARVTEACDIAGAWGVEVVGIGIDASAVAKAFPPGRSVNVKNLSQLGATGLGVLCDLLEGEGMD